MNLGQLLLAEGDPNSVSLRFYHDSWTLKELRLLTDQIALQLQQGGITQGSRVGMLLSSSPDHLMTLIALFKIGACPVALRESWTPHEVSVLAAQANVQFLICEPTLVPHSAPEFLKSLNNYWTIRGGALQVENSITMASEVEATCNVEYSEELCGLVMFSSGSTAISKGASYHYHTLRRLLESFQKHSHPEIIRCAVLLPLSYIAGLSLVFRGLANGGVVSIIIPTSRPDEIESVLLQHQVNFFIGMPHIYRRWLCLRKGKFNKLGTWICTGDQVGDLPERLYELFGIRLLNCWGSTETGAITLSSIFDHPRSIGRCLPEAKIELRDESGEVIVGSGEGEAWVKSEYCFVGYCNSQFPFDERGWFFTGDRLRRSEDGVYFFISRDYLFIKRSGIKVSPQEIEAEIIREKDVDSCGVACLSSGRLVALVLPHEKAAAAGIIKTLPQRVRMRLADYKMPDSFMVVDELPTTSLGKVCRRSLKESAELYYNDKRN